MATSHAASDSCLPPAKRCKRGEPSSPEPDPEPEVHGCSTLDDISCASEGGIAHTMKNQGHLEMVVVDLSPSPIKVRRSRNLTREELYRLVPETDLYWSENSQHDVECGCRICNSILEWVPVTVCTDS